MAIKIRLRRTGSRNRPCYRLVAADSRCRRDGRFLDILGYYNPLPNPHVVEVKEEKVFHWMDRGAELTVAARELLRGHGTLGRWRGRGPSEGQGGEGSVGEGPETDAAGNTEESPPPDSP